MISVEGVSVTFGATKALDNVSLSLGMTGSLGIVGPNGSGKSTLLDILS